MQPTTSMHSGTKKKKLVDNTSINIRNPNSFLLSQCSQVALTSGKWRFSFGKVPPKSLVHSKANKAETEPHAGDRYMVNAFRGPALCNICNFTYQRAESVFLHPSDSLPGLRRSPETR